MVSKVTRPKVTRGPTIRKVTGCGNLYVTVNNDGNGSKPIEVIARLGKNGGCSQCQNEAVTRAITLGLKYEVPLEEYIEELRGIECPSKNMWPEEERTLSCPDAIARVLGEYTNENR